MSKKKIKNMKEKEKIKLLKKLINQQKHDRRNDFLGVEPSHRELIYRRN